MLAVMEPNVKFPFAKIRIFPEMGFDPDVLASSAGSSERMKISASLSAGTNFDSVVIRTVVGWEGIVFLIIRMLTIPITAGIPSATG